VPPPSEIPALRTAYEVNPGDVETAQLLAASLVAVDECEEAADVAGSVTPTASRSWPVLVEGRCLEAEGALDEAIDSYEAYLATYGDGDGAVAVRGRLLITREQAAVSRVRGVDPTTLGPGGEDVVAVLPLSVIGPDSYGPLGRGLAAQISSDLLLLDRFTLVERMELQAIVDELDLARSPYADSTTTPTFGRLVQAGNLVTGSVQAPVGETVGLRADVVTSTGELTQTPARTAPSNQLLLLEKEVVFEIAALLGYTVSQAERTRIMENGTQNLQAFLAYSEGLELFDQGLFTAAAESFGEAQRIDPEFVEARRMLEASVGAEATGQGDNSLVQSSSELGEQVEEFAAGAGDGADAIDGFFTSTINDVAPTQGELAVGPTTDAPGSGTTGTVGTILNPAVPPPTPRRPIRIPVRIRIPGGGAP
jgi:tetratricopeptide (TPR) repeat protein